MTQKEKHHCWICLYVFVISLTALMSTFVLPEIDRGLVRNFFGSMTMLSSLIGVGLCTYITWYMRNGHEKLTRNLREVYFLFGAIFICTGFFGLLGILKAEQYYWDIVYNTRAVAVVLEVFAFYRFLVTLIDIWKIGK